MQRYTSIFSENKILESINPKFNLSSTGREDWDEEILGNRKRFKVEIVYMSPDEFLKKTQSYRYEVDKDKLDRYIRTIHSGSILPTPSIIWMNQYAKDKGYASNFHDGMHRVLALKELGVKEIPVLEIVDTEI